MMRSVGLILTVICITSGLTEKLERRCSRHTFSRNVFSVCYLMSQESLLIRYETSSKYWFSLSSFASR